MIVSIGIDIVEVYRIKETMERTPRFAARVYTEGESNYCEAKGVAKYQSYAARFAAKEAFLKALRTGWRGKITWQDIEVVSSAAGSPSLSVTGEAGLLLEKSGADTIHISLSHTADHAIAQIILERA
ncbi:MAG: holo-ACP synthase [Acidobacteriota bacterium]